MQLLLLSKKVLLIPIMMSIQEINHSREVFLPLYSALFID